MNNKSYTLTVSKYALCAAIAVLPLQALATDFTPSSDRIISDPLYLPLQGQFYGASSYTYGRTTNDIYNSSTGLQNRSNTTTADTVTQIVQYGITDDFIIGITDDYEWTKTDGDLSNGNRVSSRADGINDPTFNVVWRAMDQKEFPVTWDIRGAYSPDWIDHKTSSSGDTGTVARGGQLARISTDVGYETRDFTIEGIVGATYLGTADTLSETSNDTNSADSHWTYDIGFETQTRLTDQFSFNAGITETFADSYNSTNQTTLVGADIKPGDNTNFNVALNYTIIPDHLVAGLTYNYYYYNDSNTNYANPASDTSTQNQKDNVFGARLQYAY